MRKEINIVCWISWLLFITACTKDLNLDHLRPEPRLVLNSIVVTGEPVTASLSRTWFFTDRRPNVSMSDAHIKLYVNGQFEEDMHWEPGDSSYNNIGQYTSVYRPIVGDEIKITANHNEKEASATTILPEICPIRAITLDTVLIPEYSQKGIQVSTTFHDNPGRFNYYLIRFEVGIPLINPETGEQEYQWNTVSMNYEDDPLFSDDNNALETILKSNWLNGRYGRVFSNDLFQGGEYTLKVHDTNRYNYTSSRNETGSQENLPFVYKVYLYTISESFYKYMKSFLRLNDDHIYNDMINAGLIEPTYIHSNVTGGTGIVGGCTPDTSIVPIN